MVRAFAWVRRPESFRWARSSNRSRSSPRCSTRWPDAERPSGCGTNTSRSAGAAEEIKDLISDNVIKVHAGAELVDESGEMLEAIMGGLTKVGDIVAEIAAARAQQASGIDQVNQAFTSMGQMTQQNAALAEQTSAASASLCEKAQSMGATVGFFSIADDL